MPFYRINGMMVHIRGSKLPQPCAAIIKLEDGRREYCAAPSAYLCDFPNVGGGGRDCDAPMCEEHRQNVGRNRDYCTLHPVEQAGLFTGLVA